MNKRMRKLLVSLGMVVTLGTNSVFATGTTIDATTPAGLKSVMDKADDYTVFAETATIKSHFDGNIAVNDATLNNKIGFTSLVVPANKESVKNVSYIEKINELSTMQYPLETNHSLALDTTKQEVVRHNTTGWKIVKKTDGKDYVLTNNEATNPIKAIGTKYIDIETVLGNLAIASGQLAKMTTSTTQFNIQNVTTTELSNGDLGEYIVEIVDTDNDADKENENTATEKKHGYGITIVNVIVNKEKAIDGVNTAVIDRGITIRKMKADGTYTDITSEWQPEAGKVLFNFVNQDGSAYTGRIQTDEMFMGTILAPKATVYAKSGNINGAVICKNFEGNGCQMHHIELNIVDKIDDIKDEGGNEGEGGNFDQWEGTNPEAGDALLIAPLGVAAVGAAVVFFANRKDDDDE